jgi:hypothetical protein
MKDEARCSTSLARATNEVVRRCITEQRHERERVGV